ncbi:TolC family outer membrane protein [Thauera sp.]|uniref:TolC family outer membrane protein n=1 Tax=Thauera sp. TaxID=1905334 RepID=UPI00258CB16B|nr:TolC family outer membrane protein [Thauera sp.]
MNNKALRRTLGMIALLAVHGTAQAASAPVPDALRDAVLKVVATNPDVQARWHAFRAAGAEQDVARGGYLPQVDLNAGIGRERVDRPREAVDSYTRRGATLSLNQMLYDGFLTRSEVSRLGYARLARYYEVVDAAETAALDTVRTYADVLRYRELVQLAKDNYVEHRRVYDQIAERAAAGVGRRVDLEQASGRLALAESNLLTEVSNLHDVSARYLRLVGEEPAERLTALPDTLAGSEGLPATASDAVRAALVSSPAINAAVENVRAGQAEVQARRSANQPRIDLRARQSLDNNLDGVSGSTREGVVEVVLNYNLFRGGADQARIRQAAETLNQSRDLREKACRDLRQTLSIAYNDSARLREQLGYLDQHQLAIAKAREAYRQQFDIGQRTLLDLLDTENEYFQARRAYTGARFDLLTAQARTLAGMGQLLPRLQVAREGLPSAAELGQDRDGIDPAELCPPDAPSMLQVDKDALFAEALREAGARRP